MAPDVNVTVLNRQRSRRVDRVKLASFLRRVVDALPPGLPGELAVCLLSDRKMCELNREFRGADAPTDVLSFVGETKLDAEGRRHLGDIAICVPAAARQARAAGHSLDRELRILALHGYLHLMGYDHERDEGQMLRLQRRLERRLLAPRRGEARIAEGNRG